MIIKKPLLFKHASIKQVLCSTLISLAVLPITTVNAKRTCSEVLEKTINKNKYVANTTAPKIGGKMAFNYFFDDTGTNKVRSARKYGSWNFNQFLLDLSGSNNGFNYRIQPVWHNGNRSSYLDFLETHVGYNFSERTTGRIGNTKVPFGTSENFSWWGNIAFYSGFGENYQPGLKILYQNSPWNFQLQLATNSLLRSENSFSINPKMTSQDSAINPPIINFRNEDSIQATARLTHMYYFHEDAKVELGLSGKIGNTYNSISNHRGIFNAVAGHLNAKLNQIYAKFQFIPYRYNLKSGGERIQDNRVVLGKDGFVYTIPAKANIYSFGLGYKIPINLTKIEEVTIYDDYSLLSDKDTIKRTKMNIVGVKFITGPLFFNGEIISAKNMYGIGNNNDNNGLIADNIFNIGGSNNNTLAWKTKINFNFGAKF